MIGPSPLPGDAVLPEVYVRVPRAWQAVYGAIVRGEYVALVGSKNCGKTLLLRDLLATLRAEGGWICVYVDLDALQASQPAVLFRKLAEAILDEVPGGQDLDLSLPPGQIEDSLDFRYFLDSLLDHLSRTIVLALDQIESLPRSLAKSLLRCLRVIYTEQSARDEYRRIVAIAAGALNLFHLTTSVVSPFNIATMVSMPDADPELGRSLVRAVAGQLGLPFSGRATERILEAAGGDYYLIAHLTRLAAAQPAWAGDKVALPAVARALRSLQERDPAGDPVLAERLRLVELEPHLLRIVLDVLAGREVKRRELLTDVDAAELSGLIKVVQHRYVVRNEICESLLRRYFTSRRVARLFSAFGLWDEAIAYFERGDAEIGLAERAEYLAAVISRIYTDGDEDSAFASLAEALFRGFGVEHLVIYRFLEAEDALAPVAWRGVAESELAFLFMPQARDRPEVWVYTSGDDVLERNEAGDSLFVLPLPSDGHLPAVGVVTLYNHLSAEQYVERREEVLEIVGFVAQAGRAITSQREKQKLLYREQQRVATLTALEGVTKAIMSVRDLAQLLGLVVERARSVLGAHLVTLYLYENREERFHTPIGSGLLDEKGFYGASLPRLEGQIAGEIVRLGRPRFFEDAAHHEAGRKSAFVQQEQLCSVAGFPLLYAGRPVGVLFVGYRVAHRFSQDEIQIVETFSDQAAIAIENARLYQQLASDNATLASLYQVSTTLRSTLDRQQVLEAVTATVQNLFDLTTCTVGLLDEAEEHLEFVAHLGLDEATARQVSDLPQSLWQRVRVEGRAFFARNLADYPELRRVLERQDLQSFVIQPLQGRDRFLGVLTMGSTRRLEMEDSDWDLVTSLLNQAAVAVENAQLHQTVQQARQWLDHSLKVLSHQLRAEPAFVTNTLSTILAGKLGPISDLQQDRLEKAQRRLNQHHRLISSLKLYGRLKGGRLVFQADPLALEVLISRAIDQVRDQAEQAGLELELRVEPLPPVRGDRDMIEIVLVNLLDNALKFSPEGGRVLVQAWAAAETVCLVVDDTGPGIPPGQRELIFEEYHQIVPEHIERGSGLGLFIARRLVELHGGSIAVVDKDGAGARFQVVLPA